MIPTKVVVDFLTAVMKSQREDGDRRGEVTILKHPSGEFVILVGTTREAANDIVAAYESINRDVSYDGTTGGAGGEVPS